MYTLWCEILGYVVSGDIVSFLQEVSCPGCTKGIDMCKRQPCRPTVEEGFVLLSRGYGALFKSESGMMTPRRNPRTGYCIFLEDVSFTCNLQHMKPLEGRVACCKVDNYDAFDHIKADWATPDGQACLDLLNP